MSMLLVIVMMLYASSGITVIEADEVAVVLRLGKVTLAGTDPAIHQAGVLFALPRPFDEVVRVETAKIDTLLLDELAPKSWRQNPASPSKLDAGPADPQSVLKPGSDAIDPLEIGYILTGDRNVLHMQTIVRYRVSSPIDFALYTGSPIRVLRAVMLESMVKTAGQTPSNDILGTGRGAFTLAVSKDAQSRLDNIRAGLEVVSVELDRLAPPEQVVKDFEAVQSAFIEAETLLESAASYATTEIPAAKAKATQRLSDARASAVALLTKAEARTAAFTSLLPSYRVEPDLLRHRLYQESIERAIGLVAELRMFPAPGSAGYNGSRFLIATPDYVSGAEAHAPSAVGERAAYPVAEQRLSAPLQLPAETATGRTEGE